MDAPTCALLGAMGPLLQKLDSVMAPGSILPVPEEVKDELELLVQGVKKIHTSLVDLSEAEDPPLTAKLWMKGVREISYDMEDYFDQVMHLGTSINLDAKPKAPARSSALLKVARLYKRKQKWRSPMAAVILEFRARVQEALERCQRYGIDSLTFQRRFMSYGPRLPLRHEHQLPDYHRSVYKLENMLRTEGDGQLKVVSIIGPGGVGKTTLAKTFYQKLQGRFDCRAFVRVSSNPDVRRLLTSLFFQIQRQQPRENWDANDLIENIARCLQGKRYFIIIDDLWSSSLWDIISRAFPECGCYSQIITTTQIEDVALACCGYDPTFIFELTESDQFSRDLFFKTVFHYEYYCPQDLKEVSYEIIRQCGGLPLPTANIAGLLECEPVMLVDQWSHILHSLRPGSKTCTSNSHEHMKEESPKKLGNVSNKEFTTKLIDHWPENTSEIYEPVYTSLKTGGTPEGMKRILSLVYSSLPAHLKTCLLYLSMYPEDYTINKNDLVKQWIAEGFLIASKGQDIEEVACGFFDELVSRGLIQPVETDCTDQVLSCTVHNMVLNFIAHKSMEDNFVSIVDSFGTALGHADKVRRLSVQFGGAKNANVQAGARISQVHSLMFFGFVKCVPPIVEYKLLRVLILHIWAHENKTSFDLARICELYLLRYLKIACNISVKLPAQMRGLKFLETFEVDAAVDSVPSDIVYLQRLLHLWLPSGIALPHGMYHRTSLRKLGYFDLSCNYEDNVIYLDSLTNLHNLQLTCCTVPSNRLIGNSECIGLALEKLPSCLRSLTMAPASLHATNSDAGIYGNCNAFGSLSDPPTLIERLELSWRICTFSSLPKWILELRNLGILNIAVREISWFDIVVLKRLPTLAALSLHVLVAPSRLVVINKDGFPFLTYFKFRCSFFCLSFHKGATPKLQRLKLVFDHSKDRGFNCEHTGLDNLSMLQKISAKVSPARVDGLDKKSAESYVEAAIMKSVRNSILVTIRCVNWISYDEKYQSQEQQYGTFSMHDTGPNEDLVRSPHASKFFRPTESRVSTLLKPYLDAPIRELNKVGSKPAMVIEDAMASVSTGAMNSLVQKLGTLMGERYTKDTVTWKMAVTLKDELDVMNTLLKQLLGTARLNTRMKDWKKQMRETTYDIEDCIDECFHKAEGGPPEIWVSHMLKEVIQKTQNLTEEIRRADLGSSVHETDPRSMELKVYDNSTIELVGMDHPRDKLMRRVSDHERNLQVVCIFGARGVGKTTLATEVYNMIGERFDHRVVVPVSQTMNSERILLCILSEVESEISYNTYNRKKSLKYVVQRCLKGKRYLLLIDGVWSAHTFKDIVLALPKNDVGSVIITTTHINDVAESCAKHISSFIYRMDPLSSGDSLILFQRIVFGSERSCPSALANIGEKIVKACGGIPFAITIIAGVLAIKPADMARWNMVEKQITITGMDYLSEEGMRKFLDFCYSDLSRDMKTCLLYLSAFPKNHVIQKSRLIRRWNAEGFLPKRNEENWWETGESYFLELVARKLIEPVYDEDGNDEVPMGCKVYGLVHDFITSRSNEENLVTSEITSNKPTYAQNDVIRRLMIDLSNNQKDVDYFKPSLWNFIWGKKTISPHKIRSLAFSGDAKQMPDLSTYKFVRVLDLEDTKALTHHQLENIGSLFLLRYLGLEGTGVHELPEQIMGLQHLSTLNIRRTKVIHLPGYGTLKLVSLFCDALELSRFMDVDELEEISTIKICNNRNSVDCIKDIIYRSKRLRVLGVKFDLTDLNNKEAHEVVEDFSRIITRSNLQSLFLYDYPCDLLGFLRYFHSRTSQLRRFELRMSGILSKVPWDLTYLEVPTHLFVTIDVLDMNDLRILGGMPRLVLLNVTSGSGTRGRCIVTYRDFQCLKVFCYNCPDGPMLLEFEGGAMPQLRRLRLDFNALKTKDELFDFRFGIQHLCNLVQVRATIHCRDATISDVETVEAAIRKQVSENPNNPALELIRTAEDAKPYSMKMKKDSNLFTST